MRQWTVQDVMTRDVASVPPDASYREVVDLLIDRGVSAAPVVDAGGQVLGVVSEADLLHKVEAVGAQERRRIIRPSRRAMEKAHAATAGDLMTAPAVTVGPDATVSAAARRLESERVKRMPVVGEAGRLLGIVSRRDLLRMHTRPDRDIRADVVEQVLRHTLWVDPEAVTVDVDRGTVTLRGRLDSRSLARLAGELTAEVPGVVSVVNDLTWEFDDSELVRSHDSTLDSPDRLMRPGRD
jgi:CBS-domain-containing membrane protein